MFNNPNWKMISLTPLLELVDESSGGFLDVEELAFFAYRSRLRSGLGIA